MNTSKIHLVNVTGYALWKGNNQLSNVDGFRSPLHPEERESWPKIPEFDNLYKKLVMLKKDKKYEINRDKIFKDEALKNIIQDKQRYLVLYLKKIFSYFFLDLNSSKKLLQYFSYSPNTFIFNL